jgi:hypothetical protein
LNVSPDNAGRVHGSEPNATHLTLMLQMNAVDRRIDQEVRLRLTLKKFAADRDRATEPHGRKKQQGRTEESDEHKKRYSTIPL